jgi:hypothetical protein
VQLEKQAYSLLVEASKIRGLDFAFNEPLFSTWTLERFSTFRSLASNGADSLSQPNPYRPSRTTTWRPSS